MACTAEARSAVVRPGVFPKHRQNRQPDRCWNVGREDDVLRICPDVAIVTAS